MAAKHKRNHRHFNCLPAKSILARNTNKYIKITTGETVKVNLKPVQNKHIRIANAMQHITYDLNEIKDIKKHTFIDFRVRLWHRARFTDI